MTTNEIREKYLKFFEDRDHERIEPSPLVIEEDPTTLFTSSGMQQLVPYLMGKKHSKGKRLVDSQPSFRAVDIEEVGDNRHTTFFEMLGNWSLGDYFKEKQLNWIWEFLTKELKLPEERLYITIYEGSDGVPKDEESYNIWKDIGIPEERIFFYGDDKNWWSRTGTPDSMSEGDIGGPDSEVFYEFEGVEHDKEYGEKCHPNCECGRFLEIANSVFIQYRKNENGELEELPQKNVDFGGGLERLSAAINKTPDVFEIDLLKNTIEEIEKVTSKEYKGKNKEAMRIIADHIRSAVFIIKEGVKPSNKGQGYVLRRLLRRASVKMRGLGGGLSPENMATIADKGVLKVYDIYFDRDKDRQAVFKVIEEETEKFNNTLDKGLKLVGKESPFDLFQSYGFPPEITEELLEKRGKKMDWDEFESKMKEHKEKSRASSSKKFTGGLADTKEDTVKLHTATHLVHEALRRVLGESVEQKGSNITSERLRFDFSHAEKLSEKEIEKIEKIVNQEIEKGLPVSKKKVKPDEALEEGALAFFGEKYGEWVTVYTIGDPEGEWFSKEVCGGPHVSNTKEIGRVRIFKQKKIGANVMRIYARLNKNG